MKYPPLKRVSLTLSSMSAQFAAQILQLLVPLTNSKLDWNEVTQLLVFKTDDERRKGYSTEQLAKYSIGQVPGYEVPIPTRQCCPVHTLTFKRPEGGEISLFANSRCGGYSIRIITLQLIEDDIILLDLIAEVLAGWKYRTKLVAWSNFEHEQGESLSYSSHGKEPKLVDLAANLKDPRVTMFEGEFFCPKDRESKLTINLIRDYWREALKNAAHC